MLEEDMMRADDEARFDIWSSIQKVKEKEIRSEWPPETLLRRSSSPMSQHSLELCTEGLGSETGCDGFSSAEELDYFISPFSSKTETFREKTEHEEAAAKLEIQSRGNEIINNRANHNWFKWQPSPPFPPPLSSGCIQMKSVRSDGRLVLTAAPVPCHNHLHAERKGGRLILSFATTDFQSNTSNLLQEKEEEKDDDGVEEEEKEVKMLDTGAMVVVKVSAHPQLVNDTATVEAFRSSLVIISTFVRCTPPAAAEEDAVGEDGAKRLSFIMTASAAGAAVVTSPSDGFRYNYLHLPQTQYPWCSQNSPAAAEKVIEAKVLLALKWGSWEDGEGDMRRSKKLRRGGLFSIFMFEKLYLLRCCILLNKP
ncbi:hypothetical protein KSP40_PGU013285 [Platanthera guangdongensis]|uniref:FAF domain-containing protein n=1 Tax=Platanthera guangdongensis TaxID=2320717 RepID=A0ABR2N5G8_9ASPA